MGSVAGAERAARLADRTWPSVGSKATTVVVPVGAIEQHGPHLPVDTDTRIATAVAEAVVAAARQEAHGEHDLLLAPALSYGASGEHEGFPGTISLGSQALGLLLVEYGRSCANWASRVLFVNAHGGNVATLARSVRQLRDEGRDVAWWACEVPGGDAHAGATETSLMLHLHPSAVRIDQLSPGCTEPLADLLPRLLAGGVRSVSESGVLGDPTLASADRGAADFARMVQQGAACLTDWPVDATGRLRGSVHATSA